MEKAWGWCFGRDGFDTIKEVSLPCVPGNRNRRFNASMNECEMNLLAKGFCFDHGT